MNVNIGLRVVSALCRAGLNLPLPVPFNPSSALYLLALAFFTGLLTGCAGAGPHNSVKPAQ